MHALQQRRSDPSRTAHGKLGHSGFPHQSINAVLLAASAIAEVMDAVAPSAVNAVQIQKRFYRDFPAHAKEREYLYGSASSLKPTRAAATTGSLNQARRRC